MAALLSRVWLERNSRIFNDKRKQVEDHALAWMSVWNPACKDKTIHLLRGTLVWPLFSINLSHPSTTPSSSSSFLLDHGDSLDSCLIHFINEFDGVLIFSLKEKETLKFIANVAQSKSEI